MTFAKHHQFYHLLQNCIIVKFAKHRQLIGSFMTKLHNCNPLRCASIRYSRYLKLQVVLGKKKLFQIIIRFTSQIYL